MGSVLDLRYEEREVSSNAGRTLNAEDKEKFAYEVALGYFDDDQLRLKFQLTPTAVQMYKESEEICRMVLIEQRKIDESDQAMRIHARKAARVAIAELVSLVEDKDATAKTRMDASRQLREYATVVDKQAIEHSGEGAIYIHTNLDLDNARGVYAVVAEDVEEEMDPDNFDDLLGL